MDAKEYKTWQLLVQLGNFVTWVRNQKMQVMGLTSSQSEVICYVQKHSGENITAGDLMEQMNLSKPTVSGIIKQLEKKALIKRKPHHKDGRKIIIAPTERCFELEEYLNNISCQTDNTILQGMSEEEKIQFNRLLHTALKNLQTFRAAFPKNENKQEII